MEGKKNIVEVFLTYSTMPAVFIYCFTMLQNSSSIDELNHNLEDMLLLHLHVRLSIEISFWNYDWLNQLFKKFNRKFLTITNESGREDVNPNLHFQSTVTLPPADTVLLGPCWISLNIDDSFMELSYCFIWKNRFRQYSRLTRLTNNSVESWFGYFRNNFLDINSKMDKMPKNQELMIESLQDELTNIEVLMDLKTSSPEIQSKKF
ncbi:hypothetical protein BpHYR1_018152 [Brachionus plicatilis]|uniref:Uncharacterized protein n=1 Tax=Brachionus plicatilis TaxID=10195 RepID=A0A3M7QCJ1_BRAPC|nr:hypothetical protein BpHYR1_018152 [Brachionus plicatilis]